MKTKGLFFSCLPCDISRGVGLVIFTKIASGNVPRASASSLKESIKCLPTFWEERGVKVTQKSREKKYGNISNMGGKVPSIGRIN